MKILVTGGLGFMGSNFIRYILNKYDKYSIVNYDCITYAGKGNNLKDIETNPNYKFIQGDIRDYNKLYESAKDIDVIINYAAQTHVDNSIKDPFASTETNVMGINAVLETVKNANISKLIQISTDEVFGSIKEGSFKETSPFKPNSPYSATKAGGDLLCRAYYKTYNTPIIITHSCNNYGPFQFPEKLIPLFITNILRGKKVPVYGNGLNVREWVYVLDHAKAIDIVLHKGKVGEVYNIGSGVEKTNLEITKEILSYFNKNEDWIEYIADRPGHDFRYSIDSSKIRKELGWNPDHKFDVAIEESIKWYQENKEWWKMLI